MLPLLALAPCFATLDARHVAYKPAARPGIALAVEITGPLGGVDYGTLVIDCSLAVSLCRRSPGLISS